MGIGVLVGCALGGFGTVYVMFWRGWVQDVVSATIEGQIAALTNDVTQNPAKLRPYLEILINQLQDHQLMKAIVTPFVETAMQSLQSSAPEGQAQGLSNVAIQFIPKKYRWIAEIAQMFGVNPMQALGGPSVQQASTKPLAQS